MALTSDERDAVSTICLMAALADGRTDDRERDRLRGIYDSFSPERYERVLLGGADLEAEAGRLTSAGARTLAYEMAVAVCDADGRADPAETAFLQRLRTALGLEDAVADRVDAVGDDLADLDLEDDAFDLEAAVPAAALVPASARALENVRAPEDEDPASADLEGDLNPMILRYAVMNGALELLPQKLATLAVVPMQTKMVYRIGQHHGHALDATKAKELLGAVGLGLTSQVVETYARGLLGGLMGKGAKKALGKKKGKKAKKVAAAATGSAFQFAATYALGHAADAYYGGGRRLSADGLRALFDRQLEDGKALYQQHRPAIERQAQSTDLPSLLGQLRSGGTSLVPGL